MFRYDQDRDRFMPDRHQNPYSFSSVHDSNVLNHQCVFCSGYVFLEPFQCKRQEEQRCRAFRQLQSYLSLEFGGNYLLPRMVDHVDVHREIDFLHYDVDSDVGWPIRMVRQRLLARKHNHNTKNLVAETLLDMPDISSDWVTKILDWSSTGYVTAAIESSVHLWSERSQCIRYTLHAAPAEAPGRPSATGRTVVRCVRWDAHGERLAYSYSVHPGPGTARYEPSAFDDPSSPTAAWQHRDPDSLFGHALDTSPRARNADPDESDESTITAASSRQDDDDDDDGAAATKKTNHVKVWLLSEQVNGFDSDQKPSSCGCISKGLFENHSQACCSVVVMDWMADGQILVTGCTNGTVTFFRYDVIQKQLIIVHIIHMGKVDEQRLVSCLQLSQDKVNRHLAVATFSDRESVLRIFRFGDPPEFDCGNRRSGQDFMIDLTEVLVDRYKGKRNGRSMWTIKVLAWHPWKYSLVCYAVVSVVQEVLSLDGTAAHPSWLVLANACKGQVLKRVAQNACDSCPLVRILAVNTHSMTFSRLTGELLVSSTTVYRVQKKNVDSNITYENIVEKHSVVVMHALNLIAETVSSSSTEFGTFFAWSPDGSKIALSSSDESLKIWNFWPTAVVQSKLHFPSHDHCYTSDTYPDTAAAHLARDGDLNRSRERQFNFHQGNHLAVSELSLDASRIIK